MVRKLGVLCGLGLAILGANPALAFGPVDPMGVSTGAERHVLNVSFFGRPYPYGYTGWGPCVRYVEVPSQWGVRVRRVWVCR
jgi:hypothetical protein